MIQLAPEFLQAVRLEYANAKSASERRLTIERAAEAHGISTKTLYRRLQLNSVRSTPRKARELPKEVVEKRKELAYYAELVYAEARAGRFDLGKIPVKKIFQVMQRQGQIPQWISYKRLNQTIVELNLKNESAIVTGRNDVKKPLQMFQADFTVSRWLQYVEGNTVKIAGPNATKRQPKDGRKLWCCMMMDDSSRVIYGEYVITAGENANAVQAFTIRAFEEKPGQHLLQGMPSTVYIDRGPGYRSESTRSGLVKLGVTPIFGDNAKDRRGRRTNESNKSGRGKIERNFRTLKEDFETEVYLTCKDSEPYMTLERLNEILVQWMEARNWTAHPTFRDEEGNRPERWRVFEGRDRELVFPPADALSYFSKSIMRTVRDRLINVGDGVVCVAPVFVNDGEKVEVLKIQDRHYLYYVKPGEEIGERHVLEYQRGQIGVPMAPVSIASSGAETIVSGPSVNTKLREAMEIKSGGELSIHDIPDELFQALQPWLAAEHKLAEIEAKAEEIISSLRLQRALPPNVLISNSTR